MFNISEAIAAIRDAETIAASSILTEAEKGQLIGALKATCPPAFNRPYLPIIFEALDRLYGTYAPAAPARPAEGQQDEAPVAPRADSSTEAPNARPAEGQQEQAQNAGSVADVGDGGGTPTEAAAPAEKPKQGKARK